MTPSWWRGEGRPSGKAGGLWGSHGHGKGDSAVAQARREPRGHHSLCICLTSGMEALSCLFCLLCWTWLCPEVAPRVLLTLASLGLQVHTSQLHDWGLLPARAQQDLCLRPGAVGEPPSCPAPTPLLRAPLGPRAFCPLRLWTEPEPPLPCPPLLCPFLPSSSLLLPLLPVLCLPLSSPPSHGLPSLFPSPSSSSLRGLTPLPHPQSGPRPGKAGLSSAGDRTQLIRDSKGSR